MLPLSQLLHFTVHAPDGARLRLVDFVLQLGDVDYPLLTHVVVRAGGQTLAVPWEQVSALDMPARALRLGAPPSPAAQAGKLPPDAVYLKRDVLDALILDLQQRHVTRANDLWLEGDARRLRLAAADTGVRAVLRRLLPGRAAGDPEAGHTDWKYVEFLRGTPESVPAGAGYHRRIVRLPPGEIAGLAQAMPYLHLAELLSLLPTQLAADTLERLGAESRLQSFEELPEPYAAEVLAGMAPDVAADLLGQLETELARRLLRRLPPEASDRLIDLLRYPEDTVGGMMTNDVVSAPARLTAGEARVALRPALRRPDFVYFIYVLESDAPDAPLRGVLSLRDLVVADDDTPLSTLMNPYLLTLTPLEPARAAAYRLLASQLAALPVVGPGGQLLGAVTVDMAVAQVTPSRAAALRVFS
jgi:magnesium transporter